MSTICCQTGTAALDGYSPQGQHSSIGETQVYISGEASGPSKGTLLLLTDGFGLAVHNLILADRYAAEGWHVVVPDLFEGDPLPITLLKPDPVTGKTTSLADLDFPSWLSRHNHTRVSSILSTLVTKLPVHSGDSPEARSVGVGYCFGGKHVLRLAKSSLAAAAAFHPSFVEADDFSEIHVPVYVGLAEKDEMVPPSLEQDLREWSKQGMGEPGSLVIEVYPGMTHGFAARPNSEDDKVLEQCDKAFQSAVKHLA